MSNFNVRIVGTANVTQMVGQFAALEAQVEALNAQLQKTAIVANGVNPTGFEKMQRQVQQSSKIWRAAAASTGMWETEQIKVRSATDDYTRSLERQKLSFRDLIKQQKVARSAYREQLALQNMVVRALPGQRGGKQLLDIAVPTAVSAELDTIGNRIGFIREQVRSASTQMVNWGKNTQWAGRQLMVGFTLPVAALGAATGALFYQVDQQLTRIQKVYNTTADSTSSDVQEMMRVEKELANVRVQSMQTAMLTAKQYGAAANDTLDVQANLAATGLRGQKLQETTTEVVRIATLGEIEYQDALNASITLQSVFGQSTDELTESFNYMNAVENATSLQLADFTAAIPIAAAPVKAFGGDVQELGVLLTAMRENGIQAVQGANALKASLQRLGRPSKQVREEFSAITGQSIVELVDSSENLTEVFTKLSDVTKNLDDSEKRDVFAGLFGSYQVTKMMALVDGMGKLEKGIGQVSDASRLAAQDSSVWADTAASEIKRMQESASMQFKSALETLKIELSEMGEPFLKIGTAVMKSIVNIIQAFNKMPDWVKYLIAGGAAFMALVGPIVMLTGLFANFTGNMLKFGVSLTGVLTKFELLNKESAAARIAAGLAAEGFATEATQVQMLTVALEKLALAEREAAIATRNSRISDLQSGGMSRSAAISQVAAERRQYLVTNSGYDRTGSGGAQNPKLARSADEIAKASEVTKRNWGGIAANMGIAAAAGATMLGTSDGMVHNIANMVLYAALLAPLFSGVGTAIKAVEWKAVGETISTKWATGTAVAKKNMSGAAVNAKTFGKNLKAAPLKTAGSSIAKMSTGLIGMIGPVGLIAAGVAATGFAAYKIWEHNKAVTEELHAQAKAITSNNNLLQEQLNIKARAQQQLSTVSASDINNELSTSELASTLKASDSGKDLVGAMNAKDGRDANVIAMQKYADVLQSVGGTAEKARRYVEALFIASGDGALDAQQKALELYQTLGSTIDPADQQAIWTAQIDAIRSGSHEQVEDLGTDLGKAFADNLARASTPDQKQAVFDAFNATVQTNWLSTMQEMRESSQSVLGQIGIDTGDEFKGMVDTWQKVVDGEMSQSQFMEAFKLDADNVDRGDLAVLLQDLDQTYKRTAGTADNLRNTEEAIVKELAEQLHINQDIATFKELQATWEWQLQTATKGTAQSLMDSKIETMNTTQTMGGLLDKSMAVTDEQKLQVLNQIRLALHMNETGNLADGFGRATRDINGALIAQGNQHDANNRKLERQKSIAQQIASIDGAQIISLAQNAMGSFQQGIADATSEHYMAAADASMAAVEKAGESRMESFDAAAERASNGLENRQEARRKAMEHDFDMRIKKIQDEIDAEKKADDIRQRIYDNEQERIDRLAAQKNANIDFNMALNEGDLDEAARIRNESATTAEQNAIDDANEQQERRSERRQARLQKQIDKIEKQRTRALDRLSDLEERENAAMQRRQDAERKALQASVDANLAAEQEKYNARKEYIEDSLEDFVNMIATSGKDLKQNIKTWEKEHKGLALVTEGRYQTTAQNINDYIVESVKDARAELVNSNMWETSGAAIAKKMIKGAFGLNMDEFKSWMVTGKYPKAEPGVGVQDWTNKMHALDVETRHEGGFVTGRGGSRKGIARTSPTHPSESLVLAKRGEFMVNEKAAMKHQSLLENINAGGRLPHRQSIQPMGGGGLGLAGLLYGGAAMAGKGAIYNAIKMASGTGKAGRRRHGAGPGGGSVLPMGPAGPGGSHRPINYPVSNGLHDTSTPFPAVDLAAPVGSSVYAVGNGTITQSYDIPGYEPRAPHGGLGYKSYGRVMVEKLDSGPSVLYAHLSRRGYNAGTRVTGGTKIGLSGNVGYSYGPHLHFGAQGASPYNFTQMREGGYTMSDGLAMLHNNETVLTEPLTKQLHEGMRHFANGGSTTYNLNMQLMGRDFSMSQLAREVVRLIKVDENRKPHSRKAG